MIKEAVRRNCFADTKRTLHLRRAYQCLEERSSVSPRYRILDKTIVLKLGGIDFNWCIS